MFFIETKDLKLQLEVVPVESLIQHEGILPHVADKLILEFKNWANFQDPIIIGENFIILDGHHRAHAIKKLKFKHIPVCKIDYFHQTIQLRRWFRLLENVKDVEIMKKTVEAMKGTLRQVDDKKVLEKVMEKNKLNFGIQWGSFYASIGFHEDVVNDTVSAYDILEKIQTELIRKGTKLRYIPCQSVYEYQSHDKLKEGKMIIWTPQITKEMVMDAVKEEKVFAPKTTRHLIPARPINMNIPSYWFKENISLKEINRRFVEFLKGKKIKRFGPGQVIDGRHYGEDVFVFLRESNNLKQKEEN